MGDCRVYDLSWTEIFNIIDSSELLKQQMEDKKSGVRSGDLVKFQKMNQGLTKKQG